MNTKDGHGKDNFCGGGVHAQINAIVDGNGH